jgi:hypothetical protein
VELDLAHLEGRGVVVAHEVADQAAVLVDALGARAIGDASRLHDGLVRPHVVHDADQAVVQHAEGFAQDGVEGRDVRPLQRKAGLVHSEGI